MKRRLLLSLIITPLWILFSQKEILKEELKERALASLGGSMVYVERDELFWDGTEIEDEIEKK